MDKKETALALAIAIEKVGAHRDRLDKSRWVYYAHETCSFWSVTESNLLKLADMDYDTWAEQDNTANEYSTKMYSKV